MTTYNTYQEAKIANPDCEIVTTASKWTGGFDFIGKFQALDKYNNEEGYATHIVDGKHGWAKCNPADYCMTVEKFLADGYKFVKGDVVFDFGDVVSIDTEFDVETYNKTDKMDDRRYTLRAAALEEKKPRTKVEYVKCEFKHAWEAVKAFEDGEVFHTHFMTDGWIIVEHVQQVIPNLQVEKLYRRIETQMNEREAFVGECKKLGGLRARDGADEVYGNLFDSGKFKLVS
jgi:hypothetical protein